jgi:DNA invertase Pin-like site-specific DNA recombinase
MISCRTKDTLAARKAQGVKLGGLNAKGIQNRDEAKERAEQLRPIFTEFAGRSARAIAAALNERKIATPTGGKWHAATVIRVQKRIGSGNQEGSRIRKLRADEVVGPAPKASMPYRLRDAFSKAASILRTA